MGSEVNNLSKDKSYLKSRLEKLDTYESSLIDSIKPFNKRILNLTSCLIALIDDSLEDESSNNID